MTGKPVASIRSDGERVLGIVTAKGEEFAAPIVISAVNPCTTVLSLVDDTSQWGELKPKMKRKAMRSFSRGSNPEAKSTISCSSRRGDSARPRPWRCGFSSSCAPTSGP